MLAAAFKLVDTVYFDIGPNNFRSRRAVEKIGAEFSHAEDENKVVYVLDRSSCTLDLQSVFFAMKAIDFGENSSSSAIPGLLR